MTTEAQFEASPMGRGQIVKVTSEIREMIAAHDPYFPVVDFLEHVLTTELGVVEFEVCTVREMGNRHGTWNPASSVLALREDVYEGAIAHKGRDRFTVMHEVGHVILHPNQLNRVASGSARLPAFRCPEWQANTFSAAILMPPPLLVQCVSLREVMSEFGVTRAAAELWIRKLGIKIGESQNRKNGSTGGGNRSF